MFRILQKTYEIELFKKTLRYKQATVYECIEYSYEMQKEGFRLDLWIHNFLTNNGLEIKLKDLLKIDLAKLMDTIHNTRFKGFFQVNSKKGGSEDGMPLEAYYIILADKFNSDPLYILKNYTPEALEFYNEGIIYNNNEQSKEGQKRNKIEANMKKMRKEDNADDDLKAIQDMMKKREKKTAK